MTPERIAGVVVGWVRYYTRGLPAPIAHRRVAEIEADLHDQIAHERARGTSDGRIASSIFSRMVRGVAADVAWRDRHAGSVTGEEAVGNRGSMVRPVARLLLATALILMLPLLAMHFSQEADWSVSDFVIAGSLLFGTGLSYDLVARRGGILYRAGAAVALAAALLLVWINLAVGIIGSEDNPANLMYFGVLAVGLVGAVVTRLQADGMARTLVAMALAQVFVGALALVGGLGSAGSIWPLDIAGVTVSFAGLWLTSAWLFQAAAGDRRPAGAPPRR